MTPGDAAAQSKPKAAGDEAIFRFRNKDQDQYVNWPPTREAALKLFEGEWSSLIPGLGGGPVALFDDSRIRWIESQIGGFGGKSVLELGPLEGGHTYMMASAGARVTAIESHTRAFLRCLIVKNALNFNAEFLLGDFRPYLAETANRFDLLLMSGVLYHMTDPARVLADAARTADTIAVWTHYFDADINLVRPHLRPRFVATPEQTTIGGRSFTMHRQRYMDTKPGFCGGSSHHSYWLTRQSLFDLFDTLGFDVTLGEEERDHPFGPAILFLAKKR